MRNPNRLLTTFVTACLLSACAGGGGGSNNNSVVNQVAEYDFKTVEAALQEFLTENGRFDGITITLVDREQGTVYEGAFGDHSLDIVVQLASASKMPSVSLLISGVPSAPAPRNATVSAVMVILPVLFKQQTQMKLVLICIWGLAVRLKVYLQPQLFAQLVANRLRALAPDGEGAL